MAAENTAKVLRGRKVGSAWMACRPAHNDRQPSLSIRYAHDGKILIYCHAGCDQEHMIEVLTLQQMARALSAPSLTGYLTIVDGNPGEPRTETSSNWRNPLWTRI